MNIGQTPEHDGLFEKEPTVDQEFKDHVAELAQKGELLDLFSQLSEQAAIHRRPYTEEELAMYGRSSLDATTEYVVAHYDFVADQLREMGLDEEVEEILGQTSGESVAGSTPETGGEKFGKFSELWDDVNSRLEAMELVIGDRIDARELTLDTPFGKIFMTSDPSDAYAKLVAVKGVQT